MPGMLLDEGLDAGELAQALSHRDHAEQRRRRDGQAPQSVDPTPADSYVRRDSRLRAHPVIETQAIVRIVEAGAEWFDRRRFSVPLCHGVLRVAAISANEERMSSSTSRNVFAASFDRFPGGLCAPSPCCSHSRNPPVKASSLSPRRVCGGRRRAAS